VNVLWARLNGGSNVLHDVEPTTGGRPPVVFLNGHGFEADGARCLVWHVAARRDAEEARHLSLSSRAGGSGESMSPMFAPLADIPKRGPWATLPTGSA